MFFWNQRCSFIETLILKSRMGVSMEINEKDQWLSVWTATASAFPAACRSAAEIPLRWSAGSFNCICKAYHMISTTVRSQHACTH